jgi:glycosyltransferase involved in cell wall biosynthesis
MSDMPSVKANFYVSFPSGGIGRYTAMLLQELQAADQVDVELMCLPEFEWRGAGEYPTWPGLMSISHPIPTVRRARFLLGQFINPLRGVRRARESQADIIHFADFNHLTFPLWKWMIDRTALKVAISAHDVKRGKAILHRGWEDHQLKAAYQYADALFVHSAYQADELVDFAQVDRRKVHVVPHGPYPHGTGEKRPHDPDAARSALGLPADRPVGLFFGQVRDEKNLGGLLEALARARTDAHLLVAGQSSSRHRGAETYRQRATELGIADRVHFINRYIRDDEVGRVFAACDWVALPYKERFTSQSGVLNVAAHYECPVLTSSSPVIHETVREAQIGVACVDDSPDALAAGIDEICAQVQRGASFAFDAYRKAYSWAENARRTVDVYRGLLSGAPRSEASRSEAPRSDAAGSDASGSDASGSGVHPSSDAHDATPTPTSSTP